MLICESKENCFPLFFFFLIKANVLALSRLVLLIPDLCLQFRNIFLPMSKSKILHFARSTLHLHDSSSLTRDSIRDGAVAWLRRLIIISLINYMLYDELVSFADYGDDDEKGKKEWVASTELLGCRRLVDSIGSWYTGWRP